MDASFNLPGDDSGVSSDESTTDGARSSSKNNQDMVPFPVVVDDLGFGLSIGGATAKDIPLSINNPKSSVVGWPPIRRGLRLANQIKSEGEQSSSTCEPNRALKDKCSDVVFKNGYRSVKVNMDGILVGRKVDLCAHNSYETLAQTLEDMFCEKGSSTEVAGPSKLLDATSEFVLTYEDKDGDYLLVGDVPWRMFLSSVKRLRIMRNSESNKLASPTGQKKKPRSAGV